MEWFSLTLAAPVVVKPTSAEAIAQFRELGLRPILLTGDNATAARAVAEQFGIAPGDVLADVLPGDQGRGGQAAAIRGPGDGHGRRRRQ